MNRRVKLKDDWYSIGEGGIPHLQMRPIPKELWELKTLVGFDRIPRFIQPMLIDISRIHPYVKYRSYSTTIIEGVKQNYLHGQINYPDWIDFEATIYFMKLWLKKNDLESVLEGKTLKIKTKFAD